MIVINDENCSTLRLLVPFCLPLCCFSVYGLNPSVTSPHFPTLARAASLLLVRPDAHHFLPSSCLVTPSFLDMVPRLISSWSLDR